MAEPEKKTARRRRLPSAERRQEFINKAIDFFAEEGFESSTRGLAKRLGVTQPLLYRYFPSKEDLISEVYETVYVHRLKPDWTEMITDRSQPLEQRLNRFYEVYTDAIFDKTWLRIFLFSGLKGVDINRRYVELLRERIIEPIVDEARHEFGLDPETAKDDELEFAWVMHTGIFYYGVRKLIYEATVLEDKTRMIEDAVAAFLLGLRRKMVGGSGTGPS
ncbi:MAG: TetR/AcrR family transcriptional regulator [Rhodobacteraceae bacterium]|nr:TetR/AcrR family transcriptional regulator [Paracoccaceae bacterium]